MAASPLEVKAAAAYAALRNKGLEELRRLGGRLGGVIGDAPLEALRAGAEQTAAAENKRTLSLVVEKITPQLKIAAVGALVAAGVGLVLWIVWRALSK